eukprot:754677-Pelagomonas_calceolata.AAC.1
MVFKAGRVQIGALQDKTCLLHRQVIPSAGYTRRHNVILNAKAKGKGGSTKGKSALEDLFKVSTGLAGGK